MHLSSSLVAFLALTPLATLAGTAHHIAKAHSRKTFAFNPRNSTQSLEKRAQHENVRATWYVTDVAPGACGKVSPRSGRTIALNGPEFHAKDHCWETVTITYKGKTTTATIADECPVPYCDWGQIDMSEGLFTFFADKGAGVIYVDWDYGSGGGDPDPEPPKTTKKTTTTTTEEEETTTTSRTRTTTSEEVTTTSSTPRTTSSVESTTSASSDSSASLTSTGTESLSATGTVSQSSGTRSGTAIPAPSKGATAFAAGNNINSIFQLVVQLGEIASH